MSFRKIHPLIKIINFSLVDLPAPINLSLNWNFGSLLGLILIIQLVSGIFLAMRFSGHVLVSFDTVILLTQDVEGGWLLRLIHSTGASFFFLFMYLHMGRGIYYGSFLKQEVWNLGIILYLVLMGTAFLGYILPWGQMSYWAATVITNLLSAVPYLGTMLVQWVWGGFAVSNPTLTRFFALHYLLPFVALFLVVLHLFFLHMTGSGNPLGVSSDTSKVTFHYFYSVKDIFYFLVFLFIFMVFTLALGYSFMDAENFIPANMLVTPIHIQPEWYFLFAYAILRSIPNKLGGVLALLSAILVLFLFSFLNSKLFMAGMMYSPISRLLFWSLVSIFLVLTWLGSCPAEEPFIIIAQLSTFLYFFLVFMLVLFSHISSYLYLKN